MMVLKLSSSSTLRIAIIHSSVSLCHVVIRIHPSVTGFHYHSSDYLSTFVWNCWLFLTFKSPAAFSVDSITTIFYPYSTTHHESLLLTMLLFLTLNDTICSSLMFILNAVSIFWTEIIIQNLHAAKQKEIKLGRVWGGKSCKQMDHWC